MKIKNLEIAVYTFYRFKKIKNLNKIKEQVDDNLSKYKSLKGTILIANEGINGSLAGIAYEASNAIHDIKKILNKTPIYIYRWVPLQKMLQRNIKFQE